LPGRRGDVVAGVGFRDDGGVRVLLASITCGKGDLGGNLRRHVEVLDEARRAGCDLVVFPELSLTGSVEPDRDPERAVGLDHAVVQRLAEATGETGVAALFGLAETRDGRFFISQAYAAGGRLVGVQRKRHLGDDEQGYAVATDTAVFDHGAARLGVVICAEAGVDHTWDASVGAGASVLLMCSAPGLYGRRTDEAGWRSGFTWWDGCGLGDARRHAARLGRWVALATQAGSTADEDFPGIAALVAPTGEVVARLPDWRPGTLVVDIPTDVPDDRPVDLAGGRRHDVPVDMPGERSGGVPTDGPEIPGGG
jgi:predicted amidohydrolase